MNESNRALVRLCRRVFEQVDPLYAEARILADVDEGLAEGDVARIADSLVESTPAKYRTDSGRAAARDAAAGAGGNVYDRIRRDAAARKAVEEKQLRARATAAERMGVTR